LSLFFKGSELQFPLQQKEMLISECAAHGTVLCNARGAALRVIHLA